MEVSDLAVWRASAKAGKAPADARLLKTFTPTIKAAEDSRSVSFVISTASVDRDGDTLAVNGWDLNNYLANPVVLWAHDNRSLPLGRATSVTMGADGLTAVAEFATADMNPMSECVLNMLRAGYLKATSVGFIPKTYVWNELRGGYDFKSQELLEFSVVPVPSNPEALQQAKHAGIDTAPIRKWAEQYLDEDKREGFEALTARVEAALKAINATTTVNNVPVVEKAGRKLSAAALERLTAAKSAMDDMAGHCGAMGATVKAMGDAYAKAAEHMTALLEPEPDPEDQSEPAEPPEPKAAIVLTVKASPLRELITYAQATAAIKEAVNDVLRRHTGRLD